MTQVEILKVLREQPFRSFRLRLTNNITYDIRHPHMALVTPMTIYVGIAAQNAADAAAEYVESISLQQVAQVEYLDTSIAQANGN